MFTAFQACRRRFFLFVLHAFLKKVRFSSYLLIFTSIIVKINTVPTYGTAYAPTTRCCVPSIRYAVAHSMQARRTRRIQMELSLVEGHLPGAALALTQDLWTVLLPGHPESPYTGVSFHLQVSFPGGYPFYPPVLTFVSRIYHVSVHPGTGALHPDVVPLPWSPALHMVQLLQVVQEMMASPDFHKYCEPTLAYLLMHNPQQYYSNVATSNARILELALVSRGNVLSNCVASSMAPSRLDQPMTVLISSQSSGEREVQEQTSSIHSHTSSSALARSSCSAAASSRLVQPMAVSYYSKSSGERNVVAEGSRSTIGKHFARIAVQAGSENSYDGSDSADDPVCSPYSSQGSSPREVHMRFQSAHGNPLLQALVGRRPSYGWSIFRAMISQLTHCKGSTLGKLRHHFPENITEGALVQLLSQFPDILQLEGRAVRLIWPPSHDDRCPLADASSARTRRVRCHCALLAVACRADEEYSTQPASDDRGTCEESDEEEVALGSQTAWWTWAESGRGCDAESLAGGLPNGSWAE